MLTWKSTLPILLASSSPRRRELLQMIGVPFEVEASDVSEELAFEGDILTDLQTIASRKAMAVLKNSPEKLVIGADTIVVHGNKRLPKPRDEREAKLFLQTLSGTRHTVMTAVAFCWKNQVRTFVERTDVTFRSLDAQLIDAYITTGDPFDKAGAYGIQTAGALFVEKLDGDYFNVVGLPIGQLVDRLREEQLLIVHT